MAFADFEQALSNANQVDLTTVGRVSGEENSRPVWFVQEGETVYLLPVGGSDSQWYKNIVKTPWRRIQRARHTGDGPGEGRRDSRQVSLEVRPSRRRGVLPQARRRGRGPAGVAIRARRTAGTMTGGATSGGGVRRSQGIPKGALIEHCGARGSRRRACCRPRR